MKKQSFYLVTDTHYYAPTLGASGAAYDDYMSREQMCLAENSAIAHATFDAIIADVDTEVVILPGDLSKNGEKASHLAFINELNRLKAAGKRVYVITARHDFNDEPVEYVGDERRKVEGTTREELYELYRDFGYSDAIAVDSESLSYVTEIFPGIRMLAVNSDGDPEKLGKGSVDEHLYAWLKNQLDDAKKHDCTVFAINHYPIIPGVPLFNLIGDAKVKSWRDFADFLADNGVHLALTGHMHNQSINKYRSKNGNELYDICTSALVGYPAKYRKITFNDKDTVAVESLDVPDFDWDLQGLSTKEYLRRQFSGMIPNRINGMLSGGKGAAKALKAIGKKTVDRLTVGGVGRLLWIHVDKSLKHTRVMDFAINIVQSAFAGDAPYVEGTAEYDALNRLLRRFGFVIKKVERKLSKDGSIKLTDIILGTIGNSKGICDDHAVLKIQNRT